MTVKEEFKKIDKDAGLKLIIEEDCDGYCIVKNGERTYYALSDRKHILSKYGKRKVSWTYIQGHNNLRYYVFELEEDDDQ